MEKALYITRFVYSRQACICKHSHTTCEILDAHLNILDVLVAEHSRLERVFEFSDNEPILLKALDSQDGQLYMQAK